jgi:hypothetical protein
MTVDMTKFTVAEMMKDRAESIEDIDICIRALAIGVTEYSGGNVSHCLEVNRKIVDMIDKELIRRDYEAVEQIEADAGVKWWMP